MTVPVNPLRAVTVMVEVPEYPLLMLKDVGDAENEKSGVVTYTVTATVWIKDPLVRARRVAVNVGVINYRLS